VKAKAQKHYDAMKAHKKAGNKKAYADELSSALDADRESVSITMMQTSFPEPFP